MEDIFISVRARVFRTSKSYWVSDIHFASRKDYVVRLSCNYRGKCARESAFGSIPSVIFTKYFCACLKCTNDVFLITSIVTSRSSNIIHGQHPTGQCVPQGGPLERSVFLSLKDLDSARPGMGNVRNTCHYCPALLMEYIPCRTALSLTEPAQNLGVFLNMVQAVQIGVGS